MSKADLKKKSISERLKDRWGVRNGLDVVLILVVFALTGSTTAWVVSQINAWFGISFKTDPFWVVLVWVVSLVLYQGILLAYGFLLGQWKFFWNFEKRMLGRLMPKSKSQTDR